MEASSKPATVLDSHSVKENASGSHVLFRDKLRRQLCYNETDVKDRLSVVVIIRGHPEILKSFSTEYAFHDLRDDRKCLTLSI